MQACPNRVNAAAPSGNMAKVLGNINIFARPSTMQRSTMHFAQVQKVATFLEILDANIIA
jgi:hypothetical protein